MLRLASVLLVSVLLTTSVISGTFAKYVTTAEATDAARVAKWGVKFSNTTSLFAESYKDTAVTDNTATVKVSATGTNVVAPGTTGTGLGVEVTGTPEVSYEMKIKLGSNTAAPTLKYQPNGGTATVYEPVKFSVYNDTTPLKENMSLSDLTSMFDGSKIVYRYNVNDGKYYVDSDLDGTLDSTGSNTIPDIKIKWEWTYEDTTNKQLYDELDTILGNAAASSTATSYSGGTISDISTNVKLEWTMTATQID